MKETLGKFVTFLRLSIPHQVISGIFTAAGSYTTYLAVDAFSKSYQEAGNSALLASGIALFAAGYCQIRAIGQMKFYNKARETLQEEGWSEEFAHKRRGAWCARQIAEVASEHENLGDKTKEYYEKLGYRGYHILPDKYGCGPRSNE